MENGKVNVVIVQAYSSDIHYLIYQLERISPKTNIAFFMSSSKAGKIAAEAATDVLITSSYFYCKDLINRLQARYVTELLQLIKYDLIKDSEDCFRKIRHGTTLAIEARKRNPELITINYSPRELSSRNFCGHIDRFRRLSTIVELIDNELFLEAIVNKDLSLLPEIEGINWHPGNFPKSWSDAPYQTPQDLAPIERRNREHVKYEQPLVYNPS